VVDDVDTTAMWLLNKCCQLLYIINLWSFWTGHIGSLPIIRRWVLFYPVTWKWSLFTAPSVFVCFH